MACKLGAVGKDRQDSEAAPRIQVSQVARQTRHPRNGVSSARPAQRRARLLARAASRLASCGADFPAIGSRAIRAKRDFHSKPAPRKAV